MNGFSSRTERCRLHNGGNCLTLVQFYSQDFLDAVISQKKTVREKTKLSLKKRLWVLVFEVSVFVVLAFEVLVFEVLGFDTPIQHQGVRNGGGSDPLMGQLCSMP